jgi:hypothetical protein
MTDQDQGVRAAAASVYSKVTKHLAPDDLPRLFHETFLTLLRDPYVIVHRAAVRGLHPDAMPPELRVTALRLVTLVFGVSANGDCDGRFLSDCIEKLLGLAAQTESLTPELVEEIVSSLVRLPAKVVVEVLRGAWGLRNASNFGDLLLHVLDDDSLDDHDVERLVDELHRLPNVELCRRASQLRDIAVRRCAHSPYEIVDFIELLSRAGTWNEAVDVARALSETAADTRFEKPRKLRLRALLIATEIEAAAARGDHDAIIAAASRWTSVAEEIRRDDEENAEARQPLRGLRLPRQDD